MRTYYLPLGFAVLMLTSLASDAAAETRRAKCILSGSFTDGVETHIDTNGDGFSGTLDQGFVTCNDGKRTVSAIFQEEAEWIPQPTVTTCPNTPGVFEFRISETQGQHRSVATELKNGDQSFAKVVAGTLCFDSTTGVTTTTTHAIYLGGTGRNVGITGTIDAKTTGNSLITGSKGGIFGSFGHFTGTATVTATFP